MIFLSPSLAKVRWRATVLVRMKWIENDFAWQLLGIQYLSVGVAYRNNNAWKPSNTCVLAHPQHMPNSSLVGQPGHSPHIFMCDLLVKLLSIFASLLSIVPLSTSWMSSQTIRRLTAPGRVRWQCLCAPFLLSMQSVGRGPHTRTSFWGVGRSVRFIILAEVGKYHSMDLLLVGEETLCPNRHFMPVTPLSFTKAILDAISSFCGFGIA